MIQPGYIVYESMRGMWMAVLECWEPNKFLAQSLDKKCSHTIYTQNISEIYQPTHKRENGEYGVLQKV